MLYPKDRVLKTKMDEHIMRTLERYRENAYLYFCDTTKGEVH